MAGIVVNTDRQRKDAESRTAPHALHEPAAHTTAVAPTSTTATTAAPAPPPVTATVTTGITTPPAPEPAGKLYTNLPGRNACRLLDVAAIEHAKMSPNLDPPLTSINKPSDETIASFACGDHSNEVVIQVDQYRDAAAAYADAKSSTKIESSGPHDLFKNAARVPFDSEGAGLKIIATDIGVSRITWAVGQYSIRLDIMSDPDTVSDNHTFDVLDRLADKIIATTNRALRSGAW